MHTPTHTHTPKHTPMRIVHVVLSVIPARLKLFCCLLSRGSGSGSFSGGVASNGSSILIAFAHNSILFAIPFCQLYLLASGCNLFLNIYPYPLCPLSSSSSCSMKRNEYSPELSGLLENLHVSLGSTLGLPQSGK